MLLGTGAPWGPLLQTVSLDALALQTGAACLRSQLSFLCSMYAIVVPL